MGRKYIVEVIEEKPEKVGCGTIVLGVIIACIVIFSSTSDGEDDTKDATPIQQKVSADAPKKTDVDISIEYPVRSVEQKKESVLEKNEISSAIEIELEEQLDEQLEEESESDSDESVSADESQRSKEQKKIDRKEKREAKREAKRNVK